MRNLRPIDVLKGAALPFGDDHDPRRKHREASYRPTLDWTGEIRISDYEELPFAGDLDERTYSGSAKEAAIEELILTGRAFDDLKELPVIEIEDGDASISQGNHRTYSLRKLRDEGQIGDELVPMRIIYYGNDDLQTSSWYPRSLSKGLTKLKRKLLQ